VTDLSHLDGRLLVIFDGSCGFCNRSVRWFLKRDRGDRLRFVASGSPAIAVLLGRIPFEGLRDAGNLGTLVVVRHPSGPDQQVFVRSDAVQVLMRELPRPWPSIARWLGAIPRPVRDLGYDLVARHRYRILGRTPVCPLPTTDERRHFL
jgi:predicted DCC family thiol-disulfide oxidoreductase YuxK